MLDFSGKELEAAYFCLKCQVKHEEIGCVGQYHTRHLLDHVVSKQWHFKITLLHFGGIHSNSNAFLFHMGDQHGTQYSK